MADEIRIDVLKDRIQWLERGIAEHLQYRIETNTRWRFDNYPINYAEMIFIAKYFKYLGFYTWAIDNCFGNYAVHIWGCGRRPRGPLGWWYAKRLKKLQAQLGI